MSMWHLPHSFACGKTLLTWVRCSKEVQLTRHVVKVAMATTDFGTDHCLQSKVLKNVSKDYDSLHVFFRLNN